MKCIIDGCFHIVLTLTRYSRDTFQLITYVKLQRMQNCHSKKTGEMCHLTMVSGRRTNKSFETIVKIYGYIESRFLIRNDHSVCCLIE